MKTVHNSQSESCDVGSGPREQGRWEGHERSTSSGPALFTMDNRLVKPLLMLGFLVLLAGVVVGAFMIPMKSAPARKYRPEVALHLPMDFPDFCLRDQNGDLVCRQNLLGHVWLADFIYLQCGDTCQALTAQMITLQMKPTLHDLRYLSFSVDPQEKPAGLKRYISRQPLADASRWRILVADDSRFPPLAVAMGLADSEHEIQDGYVPYSRCMFLIDPCGRIRAQYLGTSPDDMRRLERDIATLAKCEQPAEANASASSTSQSTQDAP